MHLHLKRATLILAACLVLITCPHLVAASFLDKLKGEEKVEEEAQPYGRSQIVNSDIVKTTYAKFLPLAEYGEPDVQNFLGFMHFYGEGAPRDFVTAHHWFHRAAEQGHKPAQLNLALLHTGAIEAVPAEFVDMLEANTWFARYADDGTTGDLVAQPASLEQIMAETAELDSGSKVLGRRIFETFCSGCHGFNGIAAYAGAPSFALGA